MMFNEWEFLDRFGAAADAGFEAVEFLFPYDHSPEDVSQRLERHNLTMALFNLPPGDWDAGERGLAALPERRGDFEASVGKAIPYALATGVKRIHMMAGNAPSHDEAASLCYQNSIRSAAAALAEHDIDLLLEPINRRDMPSYFLNDFDTAAALIGALSIPNLKLQYDIYHRQVSRGDVWVGLEQMIPIIGHVQIASVPRRNEPGSGELDDFRVFEKLDSLGYTGYVGCEYRPAAGTLAGLGWLEHVRR